MDANLPGTGESVRVAVGEAVAAPPSAVALPLRSADYKVVFTDRMTAMRAFYGTALGLPLRRELGALWVEFHVGDRLLALARRGSLSVALEPLSETLPLYLVFHTDPGEMARCASLLAERGVDARVGAADPLRGSRSLLFRDPDGNLVEVCAWSE